MNFNKGKDELNMKDILTSSFLSQTSSKSNVAVNVESLYEVQDDALAQCSTMSNHKDVTQVPAIFQNFLFATNSTVDGSEEYAVSVPVSDELQFKQHIFKDNEEENTDHFAGSVTIPLTYYSTVPTNTSDLINIVSKTNQAQFIQDDVDGVACQVGTTELSEEMIRSFVVGGNKLTNQCTNQGVSEDSIQTEDLLSNNKQCIVRVITTDSDKEGESLPCSTSDNSNQQILIITNEEEIVGDDDDDFAETCGQPTTIQYQESSNGTVELPLPQISDESNVEFVGLDQNQKSDFSTVGHSRYKRSCPAAGPQHGHPSAEEIMKNYPVLHLNFNVEAEITDYNGVTLGREITTQTTPFRLSKSWGLKKTSKKPTTSTPELKVILTTDDDIFPEKRRRISEDAHHDRQYKCSRCSLRFMDEYTMDIHMKCHSDNAREKRYTCFKCPFVHSQWIKMYYHLFSHGIKKPFSCSQCNFSCVNKSDLTSHMFVHSETKEWRCLKCNRLFKHRRNMVAHDRTCLGLDDLGNRKKVEAPEPCICTICDKQLSNKRNLEKHMEIHKDVKPFVCNFCGHSTRLKDSLVMHTRIHTGEKPFKCDQCDYSTPDKSSLRRHKRRHTNEKPYCCSFCDYRAIQKHCLDTHIRRKHTGEKFVCAFCHFTTFDRYGLNQHYKQHEKGTLPGDLNDEDRTCIVNLVGEVTIPDSMDKKSTSQTNPEQVENDPTKVDKSWDSTTTTLIANLLKDSLTNVSTVAISAIPTVVDQPTVEVGEAEASLLQDIQQPGDVVFMQENGNIVIKKTDGRILIIRGDTGENKSTNLVQT